MKTIRALVNIQYFDENGGTVKKPGEVFEVSEARAKALIDAGAAERAK